MYSPFFFEKSGATLVENSGKKYIPAEPDAWATRRGASQIRSFKFWHRQIMHLISARSTGGIAVKWVELIQLKGFGWHEST